MEDEKIEGASLSQEAENTDVVTEEITEEVETEETSEETTPETAIDYEAELEKERERLGGKIDKERQKRIDLQKNSVPLEQVEKMVDEKVSEVRRELSRERAITIAERMAKSPAERDLILLHYEHSIVPTGNLEEDMANASAIANRKKTENTISELKDSLKSKKTVLAGGSDGGAPIRHETPKKYPQDVIDGAKFAGVTPEEFAKSLNKS